MDKNSLVEVGRRIVKGLQNGGVPLVAALWVREAMDEQWLLWISPKSFDGRTSFYASLADVLTKLRGQTGYFEISNVRAIEPTNSIVRELKKFGKVSPDRPMHLQSVSLRGVYLKEGVLLYVE